MGKSNQPNPPRKRKRTTTTRDIRDTTDDLDTTDTMDTSAAAMDVGSVRAGSASASRREAQTRLAHEELGRDWHDDESPYRGGATAPDETAGRRGRTRRTNGQANGEGLATGLGWFSLALGIAQIAAPGGVARMIGLRNTGRSRAMMRVIGVREVASGVGLLSQSRTSDWALARAAGDVMDLTLLGSALGSEGGRRGRTAAATAAVLGVTALDLFAGKELREESATGRRAKPRGIRVQKAITVNRSPEEVYAFWRDVENLPRFMRHLESVQDLGDGRSRWKARAPAGATVEWEAELMEDRPNEMIAWRSVEGSDVWNTGAVRFRPAPGGRGTEVHVNIRYYPPGGVITSRLAMLFREEPGQQVADDLRAFKQVMETGEVVLSDATVERGPHPAQPTEERDVREEVGS